MNEYEYYVSFVFDYVNIGTVVIIDEMDEDKAIRMAEQTLGYSGIDYPEPNEINVEHTGTIGDMEDE